MTNFEKVAIVACSNGLAPEQSEKIEYLTRTLMGINLIPILSNYLYENASERSGEVRGKELMDFYRDKEIRAIFDVSGGDLANEVLPYLDYKIIQNSNKLFWGYSDLTTIINAVFAKTGKLSVLYQIRNLIREDSEKQLEQFENNSLWDVNYDLVQGEELQGVVVGGNIRCFLKLAGTEYWPDMSEKVLLLEALSGRVSQIKTYLNQLKQMGVFQQISGIILGTFTQMEKEGLVPTVEELVKEIAGPGIPIAKTKEIGHGSDSKAIMIGKTIHIKGDRK